MPFLILKFLLYELQKYFHQYYLQYYWKNELSHFHSKIQHKSQILSTTGVQIIWQFERKQVNLTVI